MLLKVGFRIVGLGFRADNSQYHGHRSHVDVEYGVPEIDLKKMLGFV